MKMGLGIRIAAASFCASFLSMYGIKYLHLRHSMVK